jgi:hypothetical protein
MLERVENISKNIFLDQSNPYLFEGLLIYILIKIITNKEDCNALFRYIKDSE